MSRKRLKIAYCLNSFNTGGTESNAVRTAEHLDPSRFELIVVNLAECGLLRRRYENLGVPIRYIEIPNLYSLSTIRQGIGLAAYLRRENVDIVHSHDIYSNIFVVPWARLLTRARVVASRRWGTDVSPIKLERANRVAYRFAHKILANSETVAEILIRNDYVARKKTIVIPNFLEERSFEIDAMIEREDWRRSWGIPVNCFLVGIVARLSPVKNHAVLLRAMTIVRPDMHLVVIGDGPLRSELVALARELGIASRVHFVGEILERKNLHQYSDVSVLCSTGEGFPNSLIEAMAAARPIVATPVGGVIDAVHDGVNGILVKNDCPEEIAAALLRLESDPDLRKTLGNNGRKIAREKFHQDTIISDLSKFYESLVETHHIDAKSKPLGD